MYVRIITRYCVMNRKTFVSIILHLFLYVGVRDLCCVYVCGINHHIHFHHSSTLCMLHHNFYCLFFSYLPLTQPRVRFYTADFFPGGYKYGNLALQFGGVSDDFDPRVTALA
jgi:hypothetical protein